jgi:hypothetical protein
MLVLLRYCEGLVRGQQQINGLARVGGVVASSAAMAGGNAATRLAGKS